VSLTISRSVVVEKEKPLSVGFLISKSVKLRPVRSRRRTAYGNAKPRRIDGYSVGNTRTVRPSPEVIYDSITTACIEGPNGLDGDERGGVLTLEHSLGPMLALLASGFRGASRRTGSSEFGASQY